jgi:hypothetical protein
MSYSKSLFLCLFSLIIISSASAAEIPSNCLSAAKLACEKAIVDEDCINRMTNACYRITTTPAVEDPAYKRAVELVRLLCNKKDFAAQIECFNKLYPEIANDILI